MRVCHAFIGSHGLISRGKTHRNSLRRMRGRNKTWPKRGLCLLPSLMEDCERMTRCSRLVLRTPETAARRGASGERVRAPPCGAGRTRNLPPALLRARRRIGAGGLVRAAPCPAPPASPVRPSAAAGIL